MLWTLFPAKGFSSQSVRQASSVWRFPCQQQQQQRMRSKPSDVAGYVAMQVCMLDMYLRDTALSTSGGATGHACAWHAAEAFITCHRAAVGAKRWINIVIMYVCICTYTYVQRTFKCLIRARLITSTAVLGCVCVCVERSVPAHENVLPHGVHAQLIINLYFSIPAIFDLLNFPARGHVRLLTQPDTNWTIIAPTRRSEDQLVMLCLCLRLSSILSSFFLCKRRFTT